MKEPYYRTFQQSHEGKHPYYWEVIWKGHVVDFGGAYDYGETCLKAAESMMVAYRITNQDKRIGWRQLSLRMGHEPRPWQAVL